MGPRSSRWGARWDHWMMCQALLKACLWRRNSFRLNYTGVVWWLRLVYCRCQWDGHYAKSLWLKKLHRSPNIFFHELSYLLFCAIIRPLLPSWLVSPTITSFFLNNTKFYKLSGERNKFMPTTWFEKLPRLTIMGCQLPVEPLHRLHPIYSCSKPER